MGWLGLGSVPALCGTPVRLPGVLEFVPLAKRPRAILIYSCMRAVKKIIVREIDREKARVGGTASFSH